MIDFEDEKKRLEALFADTTPEQQLNNICLDLVSPLASIYSAAELLKQTLADVDKAQLPEEFERLVDHIHSTAARTSALLHALRHVRYQQNEANRQPPKANN